MMTTTAIERKEHNCDIKYWSISFDLRTNFDLYGLRLLSVELVTLVWSKEVSYFVPLNINPE